MCVSEEHCSTGLHLALPVGTCRVSQHLDWVPCRNAKRKLRIPNGRSAKSCPTAYRFGENDCGSKKSATIPVLTKWQNPF